MAKKLNSPLWVALISTLVLSTHARENLLTTVTTAQRCQVAFSADLWPALEKTEKTPLSALKIQETLMRFSKPGGYAPGNSEVLTSIFEQLSNSMQGVDASLVFAAMEGVLASDSGSYDALSTNFEILFSHLDDSNGLLRNACRTPQEIGEVENAIDQKLANEIAQVTPQLFRSALDQLEARLRALRFGIAALPESKKSVHKENLALPFVRALQSTFHEIYPSILGKLVLDRIKPIFNEKPLGLTHFSTISVMGNMLPMILASFPILEIHSTFKNTFFDIYMVLVTVKRSETKEPNGILADQTYSWSVNHRKYAAELILRNSKIKNEDNLIPKNPSLDYAGLWKDEKLNGLVVTGMNLGNEDIEGILKEYQAYYTDAGFQFSEKIAVPHLKFFVTDLLKNGEIDYFIKEAHADGDESDVVAFSNAGHYRTGKLQRGGKTETVILVYSDEPNAGEYNYLSNTDFGKILHDRKAPFVYLNTSCWSASKAPGEIVAVANPNFVEIGSTEEVQMFFNKAISSHYASAEKTILEGIRSGQSYAEMRAGLSLINTYKRGNEDTFIFPDEPKYDTSIRAMLQSALPLNIQIKMTGPDGKPYDIGHIH